MVMAICECFEVVEWCPWVKVYLFIYFFNVLYAEIEEVQCGKFDKMTF